jgi:D-serine deaminase-like pyridoxal phosphate-dependent protein
MINDLLTPTMLIDRDRLQGNIKRMQQVCDAHQTELWPHIKTHKMVEVARMQLTAGAKGLVCAKLSEAEAILPSGVQRIFIAHSLVDHRLAPRLSALGRAIDLLIVAATSYEQVQALGSLLEAARMRLQILVAVDTGLGREGTRSDDDTLRVVHYVQKHENMVLRGFYTHEGHTYGARPEETDACIDGVVQQLTALREKVGEPLELWPGCSVTADRMAARQGVTAVRPGTYVFGDLSLTAKHDVMRWDDLAATVLTTVVDRPTKELALVDAGSKTLSGDKTAEGLSGSLFDRRYAHVTKCSEEHGWTTGADVDTLKIGERVRLVPAHICPAINLANEVKVISGDEVVDTWLVDARGCVQ